MGRLDPAQWWAYFRRAVAAVVDPEPEPTTPADLPSAVVADFDDQAIAGEFTGIYFRRAPAKVARPYVVFNERGTRVEMQTSTTAAHVTNLSFAVYADTLDEAAELGTTLREDWLAPVGSPGRSFQFEGGIALPLIAEGEPLRWEEAGRTRAGTYPGVHEQQYRCRILRSKE